MLVETAELIWVNVSARRTQLPDVRDWGMFICAAMQAAQEEMESALGYSLPKWAIRVMSAFLPLATELRTSLEVRFVPYSEVERLIRSPRRRW